MKENLKDLLKERYPEDFSAEEHLKDFGMNIRELDLCGGKEQDYAGRVVAQAVTWEGFHDRILPSTTYYPHRFVSWGLLVDSAEYRYVNHIVLGFKTEKDWQEYTKWLASPEGKDWTGKFSVTRAERRRKTYDVRSAKYPWFFSYL